MPGRTKARSLGVRTVYELRILRRLHGRGEFAELTHYDELERHAAQADFQAGVRQAEAQIGTEQTITTQGQQEGSGFVDRVLVELTSRKVGQSPDGQPWKTQPEIVASQVFLDDSRLSERARLVRDGLLKAPVGQRGRVLGEALRQIAAERGSS